MGGVISPKQKNNCLVLLVLYNQNNHLKLKSMNEGINNLIYKTPSYGKIILN